MNEASEALLKQALALPPADRAKLVSVLLASLDHDQADEDEIERLWAEETERRMAQLALGEAATVSSDDVRAALAALRAERPV